MTVSEEMRIVVYPHSMEVGGSQLNAIELAAAVRDRGHHVVVFSEDGPLVELVDQLGLPHVERTPSRISPGPATARHLRQLVDEHGIDIVHGYEWPPILEGWAAAGRASCVGTVMSMAVAPFLPQAVPLLVGTARIAEAVTPVHRAAVQVMEPPVDTRTNRPGGHAEDFRRTFPSPAPGVAQVVVVSRLAPELKLEGILTAVRAVGVLAERRAVRLVIVGDGPARPLVEAAAAQVNHRVGSETVLLTGALADPRGAYDAADVCLGMGGSALRALSFAKPLVVQGEGGFFEGLHPGNVELFLREGWYGRGERTPDQAVDHLVHTLTDLLDSSPDDRAVVGAWGRELVESRFSLVEAARQLEAVYRGAVLARPPIGRRLSDSVRSGRGLMTYKLDRRRERRAGDHRRDDFNARPM